MPFLGREIDIPTGNATQLVMDDSGGRMGVSWLVTNTGTAELRLGGPDVDMAGLGFPLPALATLPITLNGSDTLYVKTGGAAGKLAYLKQDN